MKLIKKKFLPTTILVVVAALVLVIAVAANVAGSDFEIEDGNLAVDGGGSALDWANVNEVRKDDLESGQNDDSFGQGTKEDTEIPSVVSGSIPPNKSDLKTFGVYQEENGSGKFLHLFWTRVQDPSGTTNMDFEFNQATELSGNGVTPIRTPGDLLIVYELSKGGTEPNLFLFTWLDGTEGIACEASNTYPCWGDRTDLSAAGAADGSINTVAIAAGDSDGLGALDARTFGEATIDLDFIFDANSCTSFGSAYLKSRSSDSFPAALKDFIAPLPVNITNCGSIIIHKETLPDGASDSFGFTTTNVVTDPANGGPFSLTDGGTKTINNVIAGTNMSVAENDPSSGGWALTDIDCTGSTASNIVTNLGTRNVTFDIAVGQTLECTFTNSQLPQIKVIKVLDPTDDGGLFDFSIGGTGYDNGTAGYGHNGTTGFVTVNPGTYTVAETAHTGTNLAQYDSAVSCDDGSSDSDTDVDVSVTYGDQVTCTFTNTKKGQIVVDKVTNPSGVAQTFDFDADWLVGNPDFSLADGTTPFTSGYLSPGTYGVSEANVTGWYLTSATCDDGSAPGSIDLAAGETVTCTFTNSTGAIIVNKDAKNYSLGGLVPQSGVTFNLSLSEDGATIDSGVTDSNGQVCFGGLEPGVTYWANEVVPTGYAAAGNDSKSVTVTAGATCATGTPDTLDFVNDPLSTIEITFYSQAGAGVTVATSVSCTGPNGYNKSHTDNGGILEDGQTATFDDLVEGTYTCTIIVDP